jgi:hypothetical protein
MIPPLLKTAISGTTMTIVGTFLTCTFAISVEGTANKTLYYFFPHLYNNVDYAFGLDLHLCRDGSQSVMSRQDALTTKAQYIYPVQNTREFGESSLTFAKREWEDNDNKNKAWYFS